MQDQRIVKLVGWTVVALLVTIILGNIAGQLTEQLLSSEELINSQINQAMAGRFADLPGNLTLYLFWLVVAWVVGGFTEELLFRGFLINRFESLFQKLPMSIGLAIIVQALIFGQQHYYYQGFAGLVSTGIIGVLSEIIYFYCGRRLWPLILSHGLANTIGMTILFLGS